jgi:hypothetical protein
MEEAQGVQRRCGTEVAGDRGWHEPVATRDQSWASPRFVQVCISFPFLSLPLCSMWRLFVINSIKDIWNAKGVGRHHIIVVAG